MRRKAWTSAENHRKGQNNLTDIVIKRAPDYTGDKAWRVLFAGREIRIVAPNRTEALVTAAAAWGIRWQDAAYHQEAGVEYLGKVRDTFGGKGDVTPKYKELR